LKPPSSSRRCRSGTFECSYTGTAVPRTPAKGKPNRAAPRRTAGSTEVAGRRRSSSEHHRRGIGPPPAKTKPTPPPPP
jgi:hypothetical protein